MSFRTFERPGLTVDLVDGEVTVDVVKGPIGKFGVSQGGIVQMASWAPITPIPLPRYVEDVAKGQSPIAPPVIGSRTVDGQPAVTADFDVETLHVAMVVADCVSVGVRLTVLTVGTAALLGQIPDTTAASIRCPHTAPVPTVESPAWAFLGDPALPRVSNQGGMGFTWSLPSGGSFALTSHSGTLTCADALDASVSGLAAIPGWVTDPKSVKSGDCWRELAGKAPTIGSRRFRIEIHPCTGRKYTSICMVPDGAADFSACAGLSACAPL